MEFGVQLVSLAVLITVMVNFFGNKRLSTYSSKLFTGFLILAFMNVVFEFASLYAIYSIERIDPWLNRLCHQLFIGTLDLTVFFLFLYVDVKARRQRRYDLKQSIIRMLPVGAAIVMVVFGQLNYYIGEEGRYSYGIMAYTVYFTVCVYVVLTIMQVLKHAECFREYEKKNIMYGIALWAMLTIIQFVCPTALLSSMGIALMTLFMYISYENPREYIDHDIEHGLNCHAYEIMINEYMESRRSFAVINIVLVNDIFIQNTYGCDMLWKVIDRICEVVGERYKLKAYHVDRNIVGVIIPAGKKAIEFDDVCAQIITNLATNICEMVEIKVSLLKCPEYASTTDEITRIFSFVNCDYEDYKNGELIVIDSKIKGMVNYEDTIARIVQKAITDDGLEVFYQPIYSTKEKGYISSEALVRLKDKTTVGYISPEIFIPIAEKKGIIDELGGAVFEKVCRFYKENNLKNLGVEYIEVNLSGKQIVDSRLPKQLIQCVNKYELSPICINLEITETAAVDATEIMMNNMQTLQEAGFKFSMDDFGTGYSNMSGMQNMKFSLVKLDKSLIWPCFDENDKEQANQAMIILEACISMVHKLHKDIVAEGVETKEQAEFLRDNKVSYLQGYYFSRPVCEAEYLSFLRDSAKQISL